MRKQLCVLSVLAVLGLGMSVLRSSARKRIRGAEPKSVALLFREDFKSGVPNDLPMTGELLTNPNLELKLYGPGAKAGKDPQTGLRLDNEEDAANPGQITSYVWSGVAGGSWAVMLKEKNNYPRPERAGARSLAGTTERTSRSAPRRQARGWRNVCRGLRRGQLDLLARERILFRRHRSLAGFGSDDSGRSAAESRRTDLEGHASI